MAATATFSNVDSSRASRSSAGVDDTALLSLSRARLVRASTIVAAIGAQGARHMGSGRCAGAESDERTELVGGQLGQPLLASPEHRGRERPLVVDGLADAFLERAFAHQLVNEHGVVLTEAPG